MKSHHNGKHHRASKGNIASQRAERKRQRKAARFGSTYNGSPAPMTARTDLPPGHRTIKGHIQPHRPPMPSSPPSYYNGGSRFI